MNMEETSETKKRKLDGCEEVNTKTKDIYPCDKCEYTGPKQGVRRHIQSKHKGIRFPCDQCEAQTHD